MPAHPGKKKTPVLSSGTFYPHGATIRDDGVNFAIFSRHATGVELVLFDDSRGAPTHVIPLENRTRYTWHTFVHGIGAGQLYGYRVNGPYDPGKGLRFNRNKLLLDPYAKALTGKVRNVDNLLLGYDADSPLGDLSMDERDSCKVMPKCVVIDDAFDWQGDKPPGIGLEGTVIYETHVKAFTAHPSSKVKQRGTYLGLVEKIPYLKELGITAVELMPVQEFYVEDFLVKKGLTNYWGYNTIGFFAPEWSYSSQSLPGCQVSEFKTMVRELHKAGIEVIIDVVYNHTGEGNEQGPTIMFRGIDNRSYYVLADDGEYPARYYMNWTGCGNSINSSNLTVVKLIADSLRYWVQEMHVDGFRFDLATVLGRRGEEFTRHSSFFDVISQDPVLSRVKLIAEPWDLETYQVGNFPLDWCEWNGKFRDTMRRFLKGDGGQIGEVARRFNGSSDLFRDDGRTPYHSINFITCHDGFTLNDLVSYNDKHNEANLEDNRDGTSDNNSWNCGVEGPTEDEEVLAMRGRLAKNAMFALLFSLGTPMILGGDEFLRTQKGNNNAYCQDNEITWYDWDLAKKNKDFLKFTRELLVILKNYEALQLTKYYQGQPVTHLEVLEVDWYDENLQTPEWCNFDKRTLATEIHAREMSGLEYYFFIILNGDWQNRCVRLPELPSPFRWVRKIDTWMPAGEDILPREKEVRVDPADSYMVSGRSTVVLLAVNDGRNSKPGK